LQARLAFGFSGIDAWYYWINAIAVITVVSLSEPGTFSELAAVAA
jgi:hypothetical protein